MARGKIKAVLFIIVFVLAVAIGCNALIDLSENKAPEVTVDPFLTSPSPDPGQTPHPLPPAGSPAPQCLPIIPIGSMPGGLPGIDRSPGVVLVPGVGASFLGVGVLDLSPGVEDLSFCRGKVQRPREAMKIPFSQELGTT